MLLAINLILFFYEINNELAMTTCAIHCNFQTPDATAVLNLCSKFKALAAVARKGWSSE